MGKKSGQRLLPFSPEHLASHLLPKNLRIRIFKNIIFPVVLYVFEIWSVTLQEEHTLRVSVNTVLMNIHEVIGGCGKLQNDEFQNSFFLPHITRMIKSRKM
jgi:hypothetical protein